MEVERSLVVSIRNTNGADLVVSVVVVCVGFAVSVGVRVASMILRTKLRALQWYEVCAGCFPRATDRVVHFEFRLEIQFGPEQLVQTSEMPCWSCCLLLKLGMLEESCPKVHALERYDTGSPSCPGLGGSGFELVRAQG